MTDEPRRPKSRVRPTNPAPPPPAGAGSVAVPRSVLPEPSENITENITEPVIPTDATGTADGAGGAKAASNERKRRKAFKVPEEMKADVQSAAVPAFRLPPGSPETPRPLGGAWGYGWDRAAPQLPMFARAAAESGQAIPLLVAMAMVESDLQQVWPQGHPQAGRVIEVQDRFGGGPSVGELQVKPQLWQSVLPDADAYDQAGNIRLGATLMARFVRETGSWQRAIETKYHPGTSGAGVTPQHYTRCIAGLIREIEAAGTTPVPKPKPGPPAKPVDPLSVIVGGRPYTAEYGFDDQGPAYYSYFDRRHGNDTDDDTSHPGVDVVVPLGTPLYCPAAGVVTCVGSRGTPTWGQGCGYYADTITGGVGNISVLLDGGVKLVLGHSKHCYANPGDRVAAGQKIGLSGGMNGPHIHVETAVKGAQTGEYWIVEPVAALRSLMQGAVPDKPAEPPAIGLPVRVAIADGAGANRPRTPIDGTDLWITVHETGNPSPNATAAMHQRFVNEGGGPERVSFHLSVDDKEAVQILPLSEIGYHAGDGCDSKRDDIGCFRSVAIETCVNSPLGSAGWVQTQRNLVALIALLLSDPARFVGGKGKRFAADRIAPHQRWSGKNCPARLLAAAALPALVSEAVALAGGTTPAPAKRFPVDLPDGLVEALFGDANPDGPITKAWLAYAKQAGGLPAFLRRVNATDGSVFFVFDDLVLMYRDGKVEAVS